MQPHTTQCLTPWFAVMTPPALLSASVTELSVPTGMLAGAPVTFFPKELAAPSRRCTQTDRSTSPTVIIRVSDAFQPAAVYRSAALSPIELPIEVPLNPTNGAAAPSAALRPSSEASSGIPAALALSMTCGPMAWSGATITMPATPRAIAASSSLIALFASVPRFTSVTVTSPSDFASALAPLAWSTKYCWSPCFCR